MRKQTFFVVLFLLFIVSNSFAQLNGKYRFFLHRPGAQEELYRATDALGWPRVAGQVVYFELQNGVIADVLRGDQGLKPEEKSKINLIPADMVATMNRGDYPYFQNKVKRDPLWILETVTLGPWKALFKYAEKPDFMFYEHELMGALLGRYAPDPRFGYKRFSTTEGFSFASDNGVPFYVSIKPPKPAVGFSDYPTVEFEGGITFAHVLVGVATDKGFGSLYDLNNNLGLTTAAPSTYWGIKYEGRILSVARFWGQKMTSLNSKPPYLPVWQISSRMDFNSSWKARYGYIIGFVESVKDVDTEIYTNEGGWQLGAKAYYPFKLDRDDTWHLAFKLIGLTGQNSYYGGGIDLNHGAVPIIIGLHGSFGNGSTVTINFELDLNSHRDYTEEKF